MRNSYTVLGGISEEKLPLEGPRRICEDNNKIDLKEIGVIMWSINNIHC
jgi:hypothetical protein